MIICSCTGSTERDVEGALDRGADTLSAIGDSCEAGTECGGCHPVLAALLERRSCAGCPNRGEFGYECATELVPERAPALERSLA